MAALLIPPTNPNSKTIIDLDHGQQIIIDKDTHFGRVRSRLDDPNPATAINIEPSGTCWSFTLEDGVWWRNEYVGDSQRNPRLQKRVQATEEERSGREQARREWEERTHGSMPRPDPGIPPIPLPQPSHCGQTERVSGFHNIPEPSVNVFHIQQHAQGNSFPTPHPIPVNTAHPNSNYGPPPVRHQGRAPPQPPSFPPGFPFNSDYPSNSGAPSSGFPMPPVPQPPGPTYHTSTSSQRSMPSANHANGVNYVRTDGNMENYYVDQSASVTGNNNNVNWTW
ncbi:hypothetical protein AGABI1DRAFT_115616 [Agaricus bisporus var. burnettii JB137-S8]|uniref:Uncharacterized protein n=1 Tax=Agaricus bisporus var. burnettii (strain JB137-S8 / ATCC MYA-4627 / FGSC 10392) TaxID=597362 RepID=K5X0U0_AGABU|nr:uncharacterized protein AGABI1DRAFT_115616 [Agaricus bisporus var. burnettii JB137-S8]EKM76728.1 hypothetical protein AGABI1DRAFT_115616 [Agaricus bisporus var. burnettii JB137-S8]